MSKLDDAKDRWMRENAGTNLPPDEHLLRWWGDQPAPWPPPGAMQLHEVELRKQPPGVRFYLDADSFHDALEDLNRLEFVELHTRGAGPNDGRRMAVHHSQIIGLYDPDWELLPQGCPPGDTGR